MPRFRGPILIEGVETTEFELRRIIEPGATRWRELPLTLRVVFTETWGHQNAVPVAVIESIERRDDGVIWAEGKFANGDFEADKAANLLKELVLKGVSVDPSDGTATVEVRTEDGKVLPIEEGLECMWSGDCDNAKIVERWTDFEIGAATMTPLPAFVGAQLEYVADDEAAEPAEDGADLELVAAAATTDGIEGLTGEESDPASTFAVQSFLGSEITLSERDREWSAEAAAAAVFDTLCSTGTDEDPEAFDPACAFRAFLFRDGDETVRTSYQLGYCDVDGDDLVAVWAGIEAAAGVLNSETDSMAAEDVDALKAVVEQWYELAAKQYEDDSLKPPWAVDDESGDETDETDDEDDGDVARAASSIRYPVLAALTAGKAAPLDALLASSGPARRVSTRPRIRPAHRARAVLTASVLWDEGPPPEFFETVDFGVAPFRIEDDGEVWGTLAPAGQCHLGYLAGVPSDCILPEPSPSKYRLFCANRQVRCSDGSRVPVGVLTMDTTHAPKGTRGNRPSWSDVVYHYEHTGLIAAYLKVWDDEAGNIQCHGALRQGVSIDAVRRAMASAPSGDWRNAGHGLDLAGVLMVNQPAYPVYELEDSDPYMLVASLAPPEPRPSKADDHTCACGGSCCGGAKGEATSAPVSPPVPVRSALAKRAQAQARPASTVSQPRWSALRAAAEKRRDVVRT